MQGRKKNELGEKYREKILSLRAKGMGANLIIKQVPVSKGTVENIIYPGRREKMNNLMIKRYYLLKKRNICHSCGQKKPLKP